MKRPRPEKKPTAGLPSREDIVRFLETFPNKAGKREIARHFGLYGAAKIALKQLLREMSDDGLIDQPDRHKHLISTAGLPPVTVIIATHIDADGELWAKPADWKLEETPPKILVKVGRAGETIGINERGLARLDKLADGHYQAKIIKKLSDERNSVIGVYQAGRSGGGRVIPSHRKERHEFFIATGEELGASDGQLVMLEVLPGRKQGMRRGRVLQVVGDSNDPKSASLIAIHQHDVPNLFPPEVVEEARSFKSPTLESFREDIRHLPLVTIDGEDARDFDDAVYAQKDDSPENPGGWQVIVAIADVAFYVRPGTALDREAQNRGNSVYFPDRVVPMLPEELSNELCSLKPRVDRACLAVRMVFDANGQKKSHQFFRGLMKSAERLTYTRAQQAMDGHEVDLAPAFIDAVIKPLYGAYAALKRARDHRQPLNIDLPERQVIVSSDGIVTGIKTRERFDSHRLIEDFMIAANVCAAETLEQKRQPCMYRVHESPPPLKLESLREYLESLGINFAKGQVVRPAAFNKILDKAADSPFALMINEVILRSQTQAYYSPDNLGHFGLNLQKYAHFTSPIRRYSDLLVHRGLISGLGFGPGGLSEGEMRRFAQIGEHISNTERRAMLAERDAIDRFCIAYLSDRVGEVFDGRISGVVRFGLFVKLEGIGADGFVPAALLGQEYFQHDEKHHRLVGGKSGLSYNLGELVSVKLRQADPKTGSLELDMLGKKDEKFDPHRGKIVAGKRGREKSAAARVKSSRRPR